MPRSPAEPSPQPRSQLTPEDWIRAARNLLVSRSVDAVRVEVLAKEMSVTRGSFYWHFKDRDDLLHRMLMAWRDEATEQIIYRFERRGLPPRELIRDLLSLPFRGEAAQEAASTELAIRAWARRDERVRQILDEVDAKRLSYIAQCFSALGFGIAEARGRAFALYSYELSESLLANQGTAAQKEERKALMERLLLAPA
ncbi:TetR family transcriptional regulator [Cupriavidus sp. USMAA2-4]|uniref:TetR family transcriptional regulator n=1 Tax=Cupriavidus malaysiensis TaxID=367825 RepID=A0ABN4TVH4_9BURK|nr:MULTISPECIES: TetR/AcrR family transcriptional regulator [Cupriavidus]AOY94847.1 TetR family transcriptional regulator [Cupriavidus sp. USMAA2-4]AOZ02290.1 TetR family transcriptional regulator [Cupriavidus sp. USMAHM13]AOZ10331.1 TetR family transcriptional regulator [Cupriavidus malaysiensis]